MFLTSHDQGLAFGRSGPSNFSPDRAQSAEIQKIGLSPIGLRAARPEYRPLVNLTREKYFENGNSSNAESVHPHMPVAQKS